ncbi:MAG: acyltransferase [Deltaproteobacteria bacterium]|nr:acyltransferase [Deltaproteobacteria bacterium]
MLFKKHYFELDMIRAIAITMVLMRHFYYMVGFPHLAYYDVIFFVWGWHGVDLFFALSGFLIGGQIIEENLNNTFSFKRFYIKRFWRIFPPYYFSILVVILIERYI